jgi:hypothetical protein
VADPENCLPITGAAIPGLDFEAVLSAAGSPECIAYSFEYQNAATVAGTSGQTEAGKLYKSLAIVCGFYPNYHDNVEPYRAFAWFGNKRTPVPDDLNKLDLGTISELLKAAKDPALRARLGDILWIQGRDHVAAKGAALDYLTAANRLLTAKDWFKAHELMLRSLQIASSLGRKNEAWKRAEVNLLAALENPFVQTEQYYLKSLLGLALRMDVGEPLTLAGLAWSHALKAAAEKDRRREREYSQLASIFYRNCRMEKEAGSANLAAAETYVQEAEDCLLRNPPSYISASSFLAEGIEALRQAKAEGGHVAELRERLKEYQLRSRSEMHPFRFEMDIREPVDKAIEFVTAPTLVEALKRLAFGLDFVNPDNLRREVLGQAGTDFTHLFDQSIVDEAGRVTERIPGIHGAGGPGNEKAIEARMFRDAVQFHWNLRASAFIEPARLKIWCDHCPRQQDLFYLVRDNPFIPVGHESIFARGLFYGLGGDTMLAAHLLAPQIENSLRFVLEQNGVDVSNLESDLTQPVKTLGPLFSMPEMEKVFGAGLCFELRGLLIEKTGFAFRHQIAHGFASDADCYGPAAVNVWWLALRLCSVHLAFSQRI